MSNTSHFGNLSLPNPGTDWTIAGAADFNADNEPDILWQNTDGTPYIWDMNNTAKIGEGVPGGYNPGAAWHIVGAGDFNADGKSDILWQNTDGTPYIWEMNNLAIVGQGVPGGYNPGAEWHIV